MSLSEIEESLCFDKIMASEVLFYDDSFNEDCKKFCEKRNITYLPWKKDERFCYKLVDHKFEKKRITESQKVNVKEYVFQASVVEKFRKHQVLFVYRNSDIAGVVHFCDYNRNPVSIYGYALLLEFEKKLRKLLVSKGLNNDDMLAFFSKKRDSFSKGNDKGYYGRKVKSFQKAENQAKMKELESFQMFCLKDLTDLLNFKNIYTVPDAINDDLRNTIMHSKNVVKHEDYATSHLIYNFESFREFVGLIKLLQFENKKVSKQIPIKEYDEEVKKLKRAGLFSKI
jgi:hypothetical protein